MSQVGWRLMVASSANTSRPRPPVARGDIALALATKAAISAEADGLASGSVPLAGADCCVPELAVGGGLKTLGLSDMASLAWAKPYVACEPVAVNPLIS
jgi:hypothetical protein